MKKKNKKIRVGIIFGGKSSEHEVSLQSAKSIIGALDKSKYVPVLIGIDKAGKWHLQSHGNYLLHASDPRLIKLNSADNGLSLVPGISEQQIVKIDEKGNVPKVDVVFPVLHGTYGEDGSMQGLLEIMDMPYVGAGVLGSAVGMDKDVMKRLLRDAGLPIAPFLVYSKQDTVSYPAAAKKMGLPMFIKPANNGSSVGVSKVRSKGEFVIAISEAFRYDNKIIIEQFIDGREVEVSVLGNQHPRASIPGEIIPSHEFYSYEAKYIDEKGAAIGIPAKLPKSVTAKVQSLAVQAYQALCIEGMARVDMFVTKENKIVINELNTIPGFTKISMYPKLWEASGLPYPKLLDELIALAIAKHNDKKRLLTDL